MADIRNEMHRFVAMMPLIVPLHEHSIIEIVVMGVRKKTTCGFKPGIVESHMDPSFANSYQIDVTAAKRTLPVIDDDQCEPVRSHFWFPFIAA